MRIIGSVVALVLAAVPLRAESGEPAGEDIPHHLISKLRAELSDIEEVDSTSQRRRALKKVTRSASRLLEKHPNAANRFTLLGLIFECRKTLVVLRNDRRNQEELVDVCRKLSEAPDEFASMRLEPEMLLLQWDLEDRNASDYDRAMALAELADRYRDTPAEIDSLKLAIDIAFDLGNAGLVRAFRSTLTYKYGHLTGVLEYLRERFRFYEKSVLFRGRFERLDGETVVFPNDRLGHAYVVCFWSKDAPGLRDKLLEIREFQRRFPGTIDEVFSFNLDQLPDGGKEHLDKLGLKWRVMLLPDGRDDPLYQAFRAKGLVWRRLVNTQGFAQRRPIDGGDRDRSRIKDFAQYWLINSETPRYLALQQSLRIGEFLIPGSGDGSMPVDILGPIQACFVAPPMRYRLSKEEALRNYARADRLCGDTIAANAGSKGLWVAYNYRMIALLGMWNLSGEPRYLRRAVKQASELLGMDTPEGAEVVARFCLARQALREKDADAAGIISGFVASSGKRRPSALTAAAAAILSLDAVSPSQLDMYRRLLLEERVDTPAVWPLVSLLATPKAYGRLFRANYYGDDVKLKGWGEKSFVGLPRWLNMSLKTLDGGAVGIPTGNTDKVSVVVFVELPVDDRSAAIQKDLIAAVARHTSDHIHDNINTIVAFLSDEAEKIRSLVAENRWSCQVALVPNGITSPDVLRLGIFQADRRPNTFVVAGDGSIMWSITGLNHNSVDTNGVARRVRDEVRRHDAIVADHALRKGDFQKALMLCKGSFPTDPKRPRPPSQRQLFGMARAYKGLKNWKSALENYNSLLGTHERYSRTRRCACHSLQEKLLVRADFLEKLGKAAEARQDRQRASAISCPPGNTRKRDARRYEPDTYRQLRAYNAREDWEGGLAYIDDIIRGNRDGQQARRTELAAWLRERAEVLTHLGQSARARADRERAEALTLPDQTSQLPGMNVQRKRTHTRALRYVDVVTR